MLTFNIPPDHESPDDGATATDGDNVYNIVVVASDDALVARTGRPAYKKVVVTVTDVDEPGIVTLSSLQPQVGDPLTATLTDPEADPDPKYTDATWKWEKSQDMSSWTVDVDSGRAAARYHTGRYDHVGYYLRATATYNDSLWQREDRAGSVGQQGAGGAYYCGRQLHIPHRRRPTTTSTIGPLPRIRLLGPMWAPR